MTKEELLQIPFYIEDISGSENTVRISKNNSSAPTLNIEYSTNGSTWTTKTMNSDATANTFTIPANGKLYLRGVNNGWSTSDSSNYYNKITASGKHNVGGNIMSLLYGSEFVGKTTFPTTNSYVFKSLFYNNTTLVNAKDLILPATTLANYCYQNMFASCTSLTTTPSILPATTLAEGCYTSMFYYCTSLTTAPELPATTLANNCYQSMFQLCYSLTTAPELPATTLANNCYNSMFNTCSKLNYIKADFIDYSNTNNEFSNWVSGVSGRGTFVINLNANYNPYNISGANGIPGGWDIKTYNYFKITDVSGEDNVLMITQSSAEAPEISLEYSYDSKSWNTVTFTELICNIDLPANSVIYLRGDNNSLATSVENYHSITCNGNYTISDNIMSLLNSNNFLTITELTNGFEFTNLFKDSTTLVNVNKLELLPTTLNISCYEGMFSGCTQLTVSPTLPATTLAASCYESMFYGCTSLTTAPALPATTLVESCYEEMFSGCSNLVKITANFIDYDNSQNQLTEWVNGVADEGMFIMNTNATYNPEEIRGVNGIPEGWLIKSTKPNYFYVQDKSGTANVIAITLDMMSQFVLTNEDAGFGDINDWKLLNIEYSYDEVTWTTINLYEESINNDAPFALIDLPANGKVYLRGLNKAWNAVMNNWDFFTQANVPTEELVTWMLWDSWLNGVPCPISTIVFKKNVKVGGDILTLLYSDDIPSEITSEDMDFAFMYLFNANIVCQDYNPYQLNYDIYNNLVDASDLKLPNVVGHSCYSRMFYNCPNLQHAPKKLPALTLASGCYTSMFSYCLSLQKAPAVLATTLADSCFLGMFYGCQSLNYLKFSYTGEDFTSYDYMDWTTWSNVPSNGTFVMAQDAEYSLSNTYPLYNWYIIVVDYGLVFTPVNSVNEGNILTINYDNNINNNITLRYALDESEWITITNNDLPYEIDFNYPILLSGNNTSLNGITINSNTQYSVSGNIMQLILGEEGNETNCEIPNESTHTFRKLFYNDSNLVNVNNLILPQNTVPFCYEEMFAGCTNIKSTPKLPSKTLTNSCYKGMFADCINITSAPQIVKAKLAPSCYEEMFKNCSSLNYINARFTEYNNNNNEFTNWVDGVAETGTFMLPEDINFEPESIRGVNGIPTNWLIKQGSIDYLWLEDISGKNNEVIFNLDYNTIGMYFYEGYSNIYIPLDIEYSYDKDEWFKINLLENFNFNEFNNGISANSILTHIPLPANSKIYFRGNNKSWNSVMNNIDLFLSMGNNYEDILNWAWGGCTSIITNKEVNVGGNIVSLLHGENLTDIGNSQDLDFCFPSLFSTCMLYDEYYDGITLPKIGCNVVDSSQLTLPDVVGINTYNSMFSSDYVFNYKSKLQVAPELPATTLADWCYGYMFFDCTSLTTAPELPTTTLSIGCYCGMFNGCSKLTTAPELPATTLVESCYEEMFFNCSKLNYIKADFIEYSNDNNEFGSWVYGVAPTGTFIYNSEATYNPSDIIGDNGIPYGWVYQDWVFDYLYIINTHNTTNILVITSTHDDINIEYCINGSDWITYNSSSDKYILFNSYVMLRGVNTTLEGVNIRTSYPSTLHGNIMALINGVNFKDMGNELPTGSVATFKGLFQGYIQLLDASNLIIPCNVLPDEACRYMFLGCKNMINTVKLPAIEVGESTYGHMFTYCSSLQTLPQLPATKLGTRCYHAMFMSCDSLTGKVVLPALELQPYCYTNMFLLSKNIQKAELPATTLVEGCYNNIFKKCSNLSEVKALFTNYMDDTLIDWVDCANGQGKFIYSTDADFINNDDLHSLLDLPYQWNCNVYDPSAPVVDNVNYFYIEDISGSDTQIGIPVDNMTNVAYNNDALDYWETLNLEYSYDKVDWSTVELDFDNGITWIDLPANSKIYFRGNNKSWNSVIRNAEFLQEMTGSSYEEIVDDEGYWGGNQQIVTLSECNVGGDILTLMYGEEIPDTIESQELDGAFVNLFYGYYDWDDNWYASYVVDASELILPSVTGIGTYCSMFESCTYLTAAPNLNNITDVGIYAFTNMFYECYYLEEVYLPNDECTIYEFTGWIQYTNVYIFHVPTYELYEYYKYYIFSGGEQIHIVETDEWIEIEYPC